MSRKNNTIIKSLTIENIMEIFSFIRANVNETGNGKILVFRELIDTARTEKEKAPKEQNQNNILVSIREVTSIGAGFGFGAENTALNYVGDCIEQGVDIDFTRIFNLFTKPKHTQSSSLWANPREKYTPAEDSPVQAKEDTDFNFRSC